MNRSINSLMRGQLSAWHWFEDCHAVWSRLATKFASTTRRNTDRFCPEDCIRNLDDADWNDAIASIEVDEGIEVILYEDANFRGRSLRVMEDADQ